MQHQQQPSHVNDHSYSCSDTPALLSLCRTGFHEALQPDGKLVGNVRVMPAETFGCAAHFFSNVTRLEDIYVMHMFRGAWRKAHKRFHALSTQKKRKRGNQLL